MNNPPNSLPLYAQVETRLAQDIADQVFPPGCQLPTEDGLIHRFQVSRITVRKAIQNLAERGLIEIRRGTGTFVTQPIIRQELTQLTGFVEDMQALGRKATARLVDKRTVEAGELVAQRLALPVGTTVVRIRRIRLADGVPMSFDETFLPLDLGDKIITDDLEAEPIFSLLEQKYSTPLLEAEYQMEASGATEEVAAELNVAPGSPIFLIERTSYTTGGVPVDYEKLHYRGDLIRFSTRLARSPAAPACATGS